MLTGGCFCSEVRYQIDGDVFDTRCCHCSICRKAFSGAGSAYGLVEPDTFTWLSGEERLQRYSSQEGNGLAFCNQCGSTMVGESNGVVFGVMLGCLDGDPDIKIDRHIFTASKASWDHIGGDAPQYEEWQSEEN